MTPWLSLLLVLAVVAPGAPTPTRTPTPASPAPSVLQGTPATPLVKPKELAMQQIQDMITAAKVDKSKPDWRTHLSKPTVATFEPAHSYYAVMSTSKGDLLIKLMPDVAPMHVTSFIYLAKLGFYDGLAFHRVISKFMAQGGCPLGTGTGGPGYQFGGEFKAGVKHDRPGLLSMANAGEGTDGSQFFLTFVPTPWLDGKHTIFGEVSGGMDVLAALEAQGTPSGHPTEPLLINKVTIQAQ